MRWTSARLLLSRKGSPREGWACLIVMLLLGTSACVLPPNGEDPVMPNVPPEIDYGSLSPPEPAPIILIRQEQPSGCRFELSARVRDKDDSLLKARWVADNRQSTVQLLLELPVELVRDGSGQRAWKDVDISLLWPTFGTQVAGTAHTVSLFVIESRDSLDWAVGKKEAQERVVGTPTDYGAVTMLDDAGSASAIEARWFLRFEQGECQR